jgi:citrate synthase
VSSGPYYLTASHAAAELGIATATLYAYASRGQLRSEPVPGRPRERRYYREDVERLRERKQARRDPAAAAARGLHWGGPVLESAITLIHEGRFYYRGQDATKLAATATLEQTAALLWDAPDTERAAVSKQSAVLSRGQLARLRSIAIDPLTVLHASLPIAAAKDFLSYDLHPAAVRQTAARILRLLTNIVAPHHVRAPVHLALQGEWAPARGDVGEVIRTALVLCADHELNVSAFTARCAASAGASPYDVVAAAMATLKGYKHGGAAERVLALLAEADRARDARVLIANRLRRGEHLPGFGHPLYPAGDPRAVLLLRLAEASGNEAAWRRVRQVWRAGSELLHDQPNLDFGLAAVTRVYKLPAQAPLLLFTLGRTIGWIAHAIEEYASSRLIRPRARYVGLVPPFQVDAEPGGSRGRSAPTTSRRNAARSV